MNPIVQKIKDALTTYQQKALETQKNIDRMERELLPDIARERTQIALAELTNHKDMAIDAIRNAIKEGKAAAAEWGMVKSSDIDSADAALLKSGIRLNQKEYDELCVKWKGNGTMSRLLGDYADQYNRANANGDIFAMIWKPFLQTVDKKEQALDKIEYQAGIILNNIGVRRGFATGADNPFVIQSVNNFGEGVEV